MTSSRLAEAQNKSQKQNKTHQEFKKKWSVAFILSIKEVRFGKMLKYLSNFQMKKVTNYSKFFVFIRFYHLISSKSFIFFEFLFYNILFFIYENFAYTMCVPGACGGKKVQHPLLLNYSCEPLCGCRKLDLGPLQEQLVLLTTSHLSGPPSYSFLYIFPAAPPTHC